jgi:hypothetical protein
MADTMAGELIMCKECGDCTKECTRTIDTSIDELEELGFLHAD